jgi:CelD/BcsL family acetyltransferase involved in cellulose biosynthesis
MQIDVVRDLDALRRLEADWRRVYAGDPEAHFFLSWPWMSKRLLRRSGWSVLVARPTADAPPVALFPIKQRTQTDRRGRTCSEITLPGRGAADYTGFLCLPEHEVRAGLTFAAYLLGLDWQVMTLECLRASEQRMSGLMDAFAAARLTVEREPIMMKGIDNSRCPYAELPGDWDAYLAQLSPNTRQKLRRYLRKVDGTTLRVTVAEPATLELHMETLLKLWCDRWGTQKRERIELLVRSTREELSDAMEHDALFLPVLWRGETPIAAIASMMDVEKRHVLVQLGARDMAFEDLSPGTILHAHSIREAIGRGFVRYDFLRGNEPYKYAFATGERQIESLVVRRERAAASKRGSKVVGSAAPQVSTVMPLVADTCSAIAASDATIA